jgi:3-(3-hydroxy-phenyl)propionate hydroxylase
MENIAQRIRMDDLLGRGWRLIISAKASQSIQRAALAVSSSLFAVLDLERQDWQDADGILSAWFDRMACALVILRPDHYVYAVANSAEQLDTLLKHLKSAKNSTA